MIKQIHVTFLDLTARLRISWVSTTRVRLVRYFLLATLPSLGLASVAATQVSIAAGTMPSAVAINPMTNKIYLPISSSANVTVIDGATSSVITTVAPAATQYRIAP